MKYPDDDYMLSFLDRDADFMINDLAPFVPRVFFEPETGAFLEVFDDAADHVSAYGVVQKIPTAAAIEIAIPDHGQHHEWFCAWLESTEPSRRKLSVRALSPCALLACLSRRTA